MVFFSVRPLKTQMTEGLLMSGSTLEECLMTGTKSFVTETRRARNQAALGELENSGLLRRRSQRTWRSGDLGPELRGDLAFLGLNKLRQYICYLDRTGKGEGESSVDLEVTVPFRSKTKS